MLFMFFFNGAQQEGKCGAGMVIRLNDSHVINLNMGVGDGTNTFVDLISLWGLLWFTKKRGLLQLQIFGDSKIVIDWVNGLNSLQSLSFYCWLRRTDILKSCFHILSFKHIYRVFNSDVDFLSKSLIGDMMCLSIT